MLLLSPILIFYFILFYFIFYFIFYFFIFYFLFFIYLFIYLLATSDILYYCLYAPLLWLTLTLDSNYWRRQGALLLQYDELKNVNKKTRKFSNFSSTHKIIILVN